MNKLNERNLIAKAIKMALFATATATILSSTAVLAEEEEWDEIMEEEEVQVVTITGSRLRREGFESPSPVTVMDAQQIERSGATSLGDILAELPQLDSTYTSQNSGRYIGTAGMGGLDLRGLGTDRTLVLVNGRRHVAGAARVRKIHPM